MKKFGITMGLMLAVLITGSLSVGAQQVRRGSGLDTMRLKQLELKMERLQDMYYAHDTAWIKTMGRGMHHGNLQNRKEFMCPYMNMSDGMTAGRHMHGGRGPGFLAEGQPPVHRGMGIIGSVPGLTDKQKEEMTRLREKQQEEMLKLREEITAKRESMREAHRIAMLNLLTPEQKQWMEENYPAKAK